MGDVGFVVQPVPGKGLGIVAARDLPAGVLIIEEDPIVTAPQQPLLESVDVGSLPEQDRAALLSYRAAFSGDEAGDPSGAAAEQSWRSLPAAARSLAAAEHEAVTEGVLLSHGLDSADSRRDYTDLCDAWAEADGGKSLSGIFDTNSLHLVGEGDGGKVFGVFRTVSRVNHSCDPNVHGAWVPSARKWRLRTIRDVPRGTELCTSYIPLEHPREERRRRLESMGFRCGCAVCSLSGDELARDDSQRERWRCLDRQVNDRCAAGDLQGATETAMALLRLVADADGPARGARESYLCRTCNDVFQLLQAVGKPAEALVYCRRALQHASLCNGECELVDGLREALRGLQRRVGQGEAAADLAACAAKLSRYRAHAEAGIQAAATAQEELPAQQRRLLGTAASREAQRDLWMSCLTANAAVLESMAALPSGPGSAHLKQQQPGAAPLSSQPGGSELCVPPALLSGDVLHAQELMGQLARDWGDDETFRQEREATFGVLLAALDEAFPKPQRASQKVLVPGGGTGRLGAEAAALGFSVESMDAWGATALGWRAVAEKQSLEVFPYLHRGDNVVADADRVRRVRLPDKHPTQLLAGGGPFRHGHAAYSDFAGGRYAGAGFSALLTCFFVDQGPNVLSHVLAAAELLRPGGVWINLGVLAYNREAPWGLRLSWEGLRQAIVNAGFDVVEDRVLQRNPYCHDPRSMLCAIWNPVFFKAVKK